MPEYLPATQTDTSELSQLAQDYVILNPAALQEIRQVSQDNMGPRGMTEGDLDRIKVPSGGALSLIAQGIDGEEHLRETSFICLAWYDRRAYYKTAYDQRGKQKAPPDCTSRDGFIGIGDPGGKCTECPLAGWGSDPKGGRGQACKQIRQLLILRAGQSVPELINVPATSLKNARNYFQRLFSRRISYWNIETTVRLERVENADGMPYSRMLFSAGRQLNPAERSSLAPFQEEMMNILRSKTVDTTDYEVVAERDDFTPPPGDYPQFAPPTDD